VNGSIEDIEAALRGDSAGESASGRRGITVDGIAVNGRIATVESDSLTGFCALVGFGSDIERYALPRNAARRWGQGRSRAATKRRKRRPPFKVTFW
jgi:hypothetical protein